ncbi:IpaD/SipD/SspD family type III secretion system needle tip protein [Solimicrobium silvestre]|uniref:Translocator protein BipD n=1 Tax=Solimicrobium silvestre TaxID=2099400 RepID=A0A2S9H1K9_9BURK|nr:IpaD/SipD/SspD family type III secretion system needle tip protein [Solimicrobium silvestre]PRC93871.1 Invasion plasmid antigen IpaD [Solimicrobium silvestre]
MMPITLQQRPPVMMSALDGAAVDKVRHSEQEPAAVAVENEPHVSKVSLEKIQRAMADLLELRNEQHQEYTQIEQVQKQALVPGNMSGNKLAALSEALDSAEISEKLNASKMSAAGESLLNLLSATFGNAGASGRSENAEDAPTDAPYAARSMPPSSQSGNTARGGLGDIWKQLADMIGKSEKGDLADYAAALAKYTDLYRAMTNILSKLAQWVSATDASNLKVDFGALVKELEALINEYERNPIAKGLSLQEAGALCKKLGLDPEACRVFDPITGNYRVIADLSQVKAMLSGIKDLIKTLPGNGPKYAITLVKYNAWKAGFDSQVSRLEEALQERGQKYSNNYSRFESFHKTISSIIQSMADMLRQFLQF